MKLLSPTEVAVRLGVSRAKVFRMLQDIKTYRLGKRCVRVDEVDLEAYLATKETKPTWADSTDDTTRAPGTATTKPRKGSGASTASGRRTSKSPANDSDLPNWARRPIREAKNKG